MNKEDITYLLDHADPEKTVRLNLSNRDITEIPESIVRLHKLEHLDLSYNQLTELPKEIFRLTKLNTLLLVRNSIAEVSPAIGNLQKLEMLDISYNKITRLPPEIGKLSHLRTLDAGYNQINKLPIELINLLSLRELFLENNPLVFPPAKVVSRGLYSTMHYLSAEKTKISATNVMLQVYNMPEPLQTSFSRYLSSFSELSSNISGKNIHFDTKYINPDIQDYIEFEAGVDNYIYEFLRFIKENLYALTLSKPEKIESDLLDLQAIDLRNKLIHLQKILDERKTEMEEIRDTIGHIAEMIERRK